MATTIASAARLGGQQRLPAAAERVQHVHGSLLGRMMRGAAKLAAAGTAAGGTYLGYLYNTDEGSQRVMTVYAKFLPVVMHYRAVEAKHAFMKPDEATAAAEWRALDDTYAISSVATLGILQGMFVKYGQTAAGFTNTLSDMWIQELHKLEDQVPPRSVTSIFQTILEETGKPWWDTFSYFDPVPLGSASIGQVHRAKLKNGKEVAVKVQYDDSERLFRKDMATIRSFFNLVAPEQLFMLNALEAQNALELDYMVEADNLVLVGANLRRHGLLPSEVAVPQPIKRLCTRRMLVMERLPGPKLIDGLRAYGRAYAEAQGTTLEAMEAETRRRIESGEVPERYTGPSAETISWYRTLTRLKNLLLGTRTALPPNGPKLVDQLMRVHGTQLLRDGVFNADPHGGNFLLLPDDRIGLIDYGATKHFTRNERLSACLLYAALHKRDEKMLQDMLLVSGYKSKYNKKEVIHKLMEFGFDSWGKDVTGGKNMVQFNDALKAEDPWYEVPDNFVMAQLMSVRLRSLALAMNIPIRCSDWWGPLALEVLKAEGLPYEIWDKRLLEHYKPEMNMQVHRY